MAEHMEEIKQGLDDLLVEIGSLTTMRTQLEAMAEERMRKVREEFEGQIMDLKTKVASREKALLSLAKRHKKSLFETRDRIDLEHGALISSVEEKVKRIKGMLQILKSAGQEHAIKVAESVDWDVIETWPGEVLAALGTERVKKDVYAYELMPASGDKGKIKDV